jgi:hypothetical protein
MKVKLPQKAQNVYDYNTKTPPLKRERSLSQINNKNLLPAETDTHCIRILFNPCNVFLQTVNAIAAV